MGCEKCNLSLANSGSGCVPIIDEACQYDFIPTFKADNTRNFIDLTTDLNAALWTSLINAVSDERLRPSQIVHLVTDVRGDTITQDLGGGITTPIEEGVRTVTATMIGKTANAAVLGKYKDFSCATMSAFPIGKNGAMIGKIINGDLTKLYPLDIEDETFEAKFIKKSINNTTQQGIELVWTWATTERDEDLRQVLQSEMVDPIKGRKGLDDVNCVITNITDTSFEITLTDDYGTPINPADVTGILASDMVLEELSPTPGAITILSADESPVGKYTVTYATASSADVLKLTITKNGFDFTKVTAKTITIP